MIGRVALRRATSTNPAFRKAEARPVKAKTSGIDPFLGSTGYPSRILAPRDRACAAAAFINFAVSPRRLNARAMKKQVIDQTG
jgi:hypothetical protein